MKSVAGAVGSGNTGVSDTDKVKAAALAQTLGGAACDSNAEAAMRGDFVFLAVKPQVLALVLEEIAPVFKERLEEGRPAILVYMAAGWTIGRIQKLLAPAEGGGSALPAQPIIRIMPNTPSLVSQGVIAFAASSEVPETDIACLERILGAAGIVDRLEEKYLDAVTGLSGSGPAFACLFIEALADGGVLAGLNRDKALLYAAKTVLGTAAMLLETGKHPGELKDMVSSPAGTSIAGIAALENGAFRGAVINAVESAYRRSVELSARKI